MRNPGATSLLEAFRSSGSHAWSLSVEGAESQLELGQSPFLLWGWADRGHEGSCGQPHRETPAHSLKSREDVRGWVISEFWKGSGRLQIVIYTGWYHHPARKMVEISQLPPAQIQTECIKSEFKGEILKGAFGEVTAVPIMWYRQSRNCHDTSKEKEITDQMKLAWAFGSN